MLPREHKLIKRDFDLIEGFGRKTFSSGSFTIKVYFSGFSPSKFAVVLSSKTARKAHERNKIKRQTRSIISKKLKLFQKGFAVVIYPKKTDKEENFELMEKDLNNLFKRSGLLK